jgi:hypothetical protein
MVNAFSDDIRSKCKFCFCPHAVQIQGRDAALLKKSRYENKK